MAFLRNRWYCASWSHDLQDRPLGRWILGEYLVLYRDSAKTAVALGGRCPHRFAPLDQGAVNGDRLVCPYHGLQFGPDGRCVLNPHGDGLIPPRTEVPRYASAERDGAVFVWMGDADNADEALLPRAPYVTSSDYATAFIQRTVATNYQLLVDNLLDLTHAPFLHGRTLWTKDQGGQMASPRYEFYTDGEVVHSDYYFDDVDVAPRVATMLADPRAKLTTKMTWRPAATMELDLLHEPIGASNAEPLHLPSVRYLTPATETSTHYFAALSRNRNLDDLEEDERIRFNSLQAFADEDEPMVRACQELMGTTDLFSLRPIILQSDVAAVQARRVLTHLIKAEQAASA